MKDYFFTIKETSESLYKEKGSKFIGLSFSVESEDEIKNRLEEVRKRFHDARHHCYAYRLDPEGKTVRANDDGEPNHSAGDPILGQIKSFDLTNTLVIVVRYFGGTKLGVSGLITAYKTAAEEALKQSGSLKKWLEDYFEVEYTYERTNEFMRVTDEFNSRTIEQDFGAKCYAKVAVKKSSATAFEQSLRKLGDVRISAIKN